VPPATLKSMLSLISMVPGISDGGQCPPLGFGHFYNT
jgi:hypothetical protein